MEEEGGCGETEDSLAECGASAAEGQEDDPEDFFAFGNGEPTQGSKMKASKTPPTAPVEWLLRANACV